MADIFCDSFDHYATGDILKKWDSVSGSPAIVSTGGRRGGGYLSCEKNQVYKGLDGTTTTYVVGVAVNHQGYDGGNPFIRFLHSSSTVCEVGTDSSGHIYVTNGSTTWTATATLGTLAWHYVELKVKFTSSTATGDVEVKVDGVSVVIAPASSNFGTIPDQFGLGSFSGFINDFLMYFDDFVLQIASTTYFGDVIVEALKPNAAGNYSDFSNNGSSQSYNCVNESAPDGDTTYVSSGTTNNRESFKYPALSQTPGTVYGVQHLICAKKTGTSFRTLTPFIRQSGSNYDDSPINLTGSYAYLRKTYATNPATSAAFTASEITNLETGVKVG